jgi:hypothetical protein
MVTAHSLQEMACDTTMWRAQFARGGAVARSPAALW